MKKSPKNQPLVSVVLLNWNHIEDTLACLESLRKQTYRHFEIIVVDNGSIDNSKAILKDISDIVFVDNPKNRGFTGGHIDGLKFTKGEFVFVLNNDAVVDSKYIQTAVEILQNNPQAAVVGGRSYKWENEDEIFNDTGSFYAFQTINPVSAEGIFSQTDAGFNHEVSWVSGSAMVIRKNVLKDAGYFYDPIFAYYEETDLFARILAHNHTIIYSPFLKIWHKNGASSSSYFQLNQLFKNRFIFGLRNLTTAELVKFIRSYAKTSLRGSYHHLLRRANDEESKTLNKAIFKALGRSSITWPRWLLSRKGVKMRDNNKLTYMDKVKLEQTGISFIYDASSADVLPSKIIDFITTISFKHFESEFIIVCMPNQQKKIEKQLSDNSLGQRNARLAITTSQSKSHPLNIGWLSAAKDFVWFVSKDYQPTPSSVTTACLNLAGAKELSVFAEITKPASKNMNLVHPTQNICLSRATLSLYGGIDTGSMTQALANLYFFAKKSRDITLYEYQSSSSPKQYNISPDTIAKVKLAIHSYGDQKRRNTRYNKLLEKYYRLYQLNNLLTWFFIREISNRHKAARIRNTLVATIKLQRKNLATELKHISNEVIKTKHSGFDQQEREKEIAEKITSVLTADHWKSTPIFIICRDRLSDLILLIKWLESADMKNIILVDNDSAYPPIVQYLEKTSYQVIKTKKNIGHTVVWKEGIAKTLFPGQFYIVNDPDVIPDKDCPKDAIRYFYSLHKKYKGYQKVGFGLKINDLPGKYKLKEQVLDWEQQFWKTPLEDNVFDAAVDTTFALYKPYTDFYMLHPSIRTGGPYVAKHLAWYVDSEKISEEEAFYRLHASQDITSWNTDEVLERYKKAFKKK